MINEFDAVGPTQIPVTEEGYALIDLFVHFPHSQVYLKFLQQGDQVTQTRLDVLKSQHDRGIYVRRGALDEADLLRRFPERFEFLKRQARNPEEDANLLRSFSGELDERLKGLGHREGALLKNFSTKVKAWEDLADSLLKQILPLNYGIPRNALFSAQILTEIEKSFALCSLVTMVFSSESLESRALLREAALAVLLMDAPLRSIPNRTLSRYEQEPGSLTLNEFNKIRQHPIEAAHFASRSIRDFPPRSSQFILCHHELENGLGYPRKLNGPQLSPEVRAFNLAVSVYERLCKKKSRGENLDLLAIVDEIREPHIEIRLRKHNQQQVENFHSYLACCREVID